MHSIVAYHIAKPTNLISPLLMIDDTTPLIRSYLQRSAAAAQAKLSDRRGDAEPVRLYYTQIVTSDDDRAVPFPVPPSH